MFQDLNVIVISYNTKELTIACIASLLDCGLTPNQIIVVDNNSNDGSIQYISTNYPKINLITNNDNFGYAKAVNIGINLVNSKYVLISNSDVIYNQNSLQIIFNSIISYPEYALLGSIQKFPSGKLQRSYGFLPSIKKSLRDLFFINAIKSKIFKYLPFKIKISKNIKEVEYVDGASIICRTEELKKIGLFDEDYFFYSEEADLCKRFQENKMKVGICLDATIIHHRGASTKGINKNSIELNVKSKRIYCNKHLSNFETKIYFLSEAFHFLSLTLINSIFGFIFILFGSSKYINRAEICFYNFFYFLVYLRKND